MPMSGASARRCGPRCPASACSCRARCCRRSASSSAPARPRCAPTSGRCWPSYLAGCSRAVIELGPAGAAGHGLERRRVRHRAKALRMPAMAVESGPAAGVIAAALVGRQLGLANLISFDMGGTTAKASLIARGEITITRGIRGRRRRQRQPLAARHRPSDPRAGDRPGRGERRRRLDRLDRSAAASLRVGPAERRRRPGPAATARAAPADGDRRRSRARLSGSGALLGGALPVDLARRARAIEAAIGRPLGLGVPEAAAGIVEVVNARHGRGAAHRLGRARPRPARVHAWSPSAAPAPCTPRARRGAGDPAR